TFSWNLPSVSALSEVASCWVELPDGAERVALAAGSGAGHIRLLHTLFSRTSSCGHHCCERIWATFFCRHRTRQHLRSAVSSRKIWAGRPAHLKEFLRGLISAYQAHHRVPRRRPGPSRKRRAV